MRYAVSLWASLLILGCSVPQTPAPESDASSADRVRETELADLRHYPQSATAYAGNITEHAVADASQRGFETRWFSPWNLQALPYTLEEVLWPFRTYRPENAYGENLRPIDPAWFDVMYENANFEAYGTLNAKAVTLRYASLRNFPTRRPLFRDPEKAGEGFPFDYMQNSGVHANEPLLVSHYSKDGAWAYVFTSYATGWLKSDEIAFIPPEHVKKWEAAQQVYVIAEGIPVRDGTGRFLVEGRIGMLLPLVARGKHYDRVLVVTPGPDGKGWYREGLIPADAVTESPLSLDAEMLPKIADALLQSRYGWGGLFGERDCSSTLRDLFAPFGIWLPRNSSQQARVGRVIPLKELTPEEKIARIEQEGVPFETLLYRKGHIVLYLGLYEGEVMVLQNLWGVKTIDGEEEGRHIVGRSVISTLQLGSERSDYDASNAFATQLESMNIITQRPSDLDVQE